MQPSVEAMIFFVRDCFIFLHREDSVKPQVVGPTTNAPYNHEDGTLQDLKAFQK